MPEQEIEPGPDPLAFIPQRGLSLGMLGFVPHPNLGPTALSPERQQN